jgi:hypothetical protein
MCFYKREKFVGIYFVHHTILQKIRKIAYSNCVLEPWQSYLNKPY